MYGVELDRVDREIGIRAPSSSVGWSGIFRWGIGARFGVDACRCCPAESCAALPDRRSSDGAGCRCGVGGFAGTAVLLGRPGGTGSPPRAPGSCFGRAGGASVVIGEGSGTRIEPERFREGTEPGWREEAVPDLTSGDPLFPVGVDGVGGVVEVEAEDEADGGDLSGLGCAAGGVGSCEAVPLFTSGIRGTFPTSSENE